MSVGGCTGHLRTALAIAMFSAVVSAFGVVGVANAQDAAKSNIAADQATKAPAWSEFHYPERGFVVSFPGASEKPKAESTPVPGQNPLLQHEYKVEAGKDTVYCVVVFEYPEGRAPNPPKKDYFEKVVTAYAKGSDTKLRRQTPLKIDKRPGFEAKAEDSRGKLNHLVTMVANGDRVYMLISAGPKKHATSEDALRFRDSFRLLGGPPPPSSPKKDG
ncbi:MAG: hypothetical protein QNJ62_05310 [Methyloceanibacter sp.]|nr:hypothetical protein [Methyloceanibacter sp.]